MKTGRFTTEEVSKLEFGMDFRDPKYRREVFLRFYEFHIKYKAHPGAVYYAFPYIFNKFKLTTEQKYWFCFLNGVCQNVLTTYELFSHMPKLPETQEEQDKLFKFFRDNYKKFGWDSDRKYVKNKFEAVVKGYLSNLGGLTQAQYFYNICDSSSGNEFENFKKLWEVVMRDFPYFGRLSTFSYLEYMRIAGLKIDCDSLFLDDISGSKSHRNGLCKVLGRDDLDWHDKYNPSFDGKYSNEVLEWLEKEGEDLLMEAHCRFSDKDVGYFTLESTLCCFKSWFRPNRRYPNVYNDMFFLRIKKHEEMWGKKMDLFWEMRKECLPENLRLEDNPKDVGLTGIKQNHFRNTGQVIMMDKDWDCFKNDYNDFVEKK